MEEFLRSLTADTVIALMCLVSIGYGMFSAFLISAHYRYRKDLRPYQAKFLLGGSVAGFIIFIVFLIFCPKTTPEMIPPQEMIDSAMGFLFLFTGGISLSLIVALLNWRMAKQLNKSSKKI